MNAEDLRFHLGFKSSNRERWNSGKVTHFERNIAFVEEVITMSRYMGNIAGGRLL